MKKHYMAERIIRLLRQAEVELARAVGWGDLPRAWGV